MRRFGRAAAVGVMLVLLTACTATTDAPRPSPAAEPGVAESQASVSPTGEAQRYPDVIDARLAASGDEYTVSVTISSPYDTPQRYADGWRVLTPDGELLAEHQLAHDHAAEQPFTRTSGPFAIPEDVAEVTVEGRDQANGYGGETVTIDVPR